MLTIVDAERVRLVTLNRPEARNAFNSALYHGVADALEEAAANDDICVVVLTGAGRGFCAGQDLSEMGQLGGLASPDHGVYHFVDAISAFPKPLIAAVNGVAVGIGVTLLGCCDLVLASPEARFRAPFVSLGLVPETGATFTFPAILGWQNAAHFLLTAEWMSADQALAQGLVWKMVAPDELVDAAMERATAMAKQPLKSLVATKQLLLDARLDSFRAARGREEPIFASFVGGWANREALAAFVEKREPDFYQGKGP